jgi:hypothetical protein
VADFLLSLLYVFIRFFNAFYVKTHADFSIPAVAGVSAVAVVSVIPMFLLLWASRK